MTKNENITPDQIIQWYMDDVLTSKDQNSTVYSFAKKYNFDEALFYEHFSSLEVLDKEIFALFCTKTIVLLKDSEEFETYESRNKLLSFYYTFFELLAANRSYVFLRLKQHKNKLSSLQFLTLMRKEFLEFTKYIGVEAIDLKNDKIEKIQEKGISESLWVQLLITIKFWLNDNSKGFEKTDIFIEKSIKAQFDLIDMTPLKSVFDFAKFLWKEKTM